MPDPQYPWDSPRSYAVHPRRRLDDPATLQDGEEADKGGWGDVLTLPNAFRIGGALAGGLIGSAVGPEGTAAGLMIGGGAGAGLGEGLAELMEVRRHQRESVNLKQVGVQTALGAIPLGGGGLPSVLGKGALMGVGGTVASELAERGDFPTTEQVARGGLFGLVTAGGVHVALSPFLRPGAPSLSYPREGAPMRPVPKWPMVEPPTASPFDGASLREPALRRGPAGMASLEADTAPLPGSDRFRAPYAGPIRSRFPDGQGLDALNPPATGPDIFATRVGRPRMGRPLPEGFDALNAELGDLNALPGPSALPDLMGLPRRRTVIPQPEAPTPAEPQPAAPLVRARPTFLSVVAPHGASQPPAAPRGGRFQGLPQIRTQQFGPDDGGVSSGQAAVEPGGQQPRLPQDGNDSPYARPVNLHGYVPMGDAPIGDMRLVPRNGETPGGFIPANESMQHLSIDDLEGMLNSQNPDNQALAADEIKRRYGGGQAERPPAPSLTRPLLPSGLDANPPVGGELPPMGPTQSYPRIGNEPVGEMPLGRPLPEGFDELNAELGDLNVGEAPGFGEAPPAPGPHPSLTRPILPSGLDPNPPTGGELPPYEPLGRYPRGGPIPDVPHGTPPPDRPPLNPLDRGEGPFPSMARPLVPSGVDPNPPQGGELPPYGPSGGYPRGGPMPDVPPGPREPGGPPLNPLDRGPGPFPSLERPLVPSAVDPNGPALDQNLPPELRALLGDEKPPDPLQALQDAAKEATDAPVAHQLEDLAANPNTNPVTGLPNRRAWERMGGKPGRLVGRIDLDNFKRLNDSQGHAAGDRALRVVGKVLQRFARRQGDMAVHISGDEFGLNLEHTANLTPGAVTALRDRIETEIAEALEAAGLADAGEGARVGASLGFGADDAAADAAAGLRKAQRGVSRPRAVNPAPPPVPGGETAPQGQPGAPAGPPQAASDGLVDAAAVKVDAKTYQFKGGADAQGVTDRLQGVESWDPMAGLASPVVVHKRLNGDLYVVDGHQRVGLAKRLASHGRPVPPLRVVVLDEAAGVTVEKARRIGAMLNLQQGTGTATDVAKVLRASPLTSAERARIPKDSVSGNKLRMGEELAKLGDAAFSHVVNGQVDPNPARNESFGAIVGRLVSDPAEQMAALQQLAKAAPENAYEAEQFVRAIQADGFERYVPGDLFGADEEVATSLAEPISKVMGAVRRVLVSSKSALGNAIKNEGRLAAGGNILNTEGNKAGYETAGYLDRLLDSYGHTKGPVREELKRVAAQVFRGEITTGQAADAVIAALEAERAAGRTPTVQPKRPGVSTPVSGHDAPGGRPPAPAPPAAPPVDAGPLSDILPTGEEQPRLPGDVGAVREGEAPTPGVADLPPQQDAAATDQAARQARLEELQAKPRLTTLELAELQSLRDGGNVKPPEPPGLFPDSGGLDFVGEDDPAPLPPELTAAAEEPPVEPPVEEPPVEPPVEPSASDGLPPEVREAAGLEAIETRHDVRNPKKAADIAASMKRVGYKGDKLLIIQDGDRRIAWTGTHRLEAAKQAGLTVDQVPMHVVNADNLRAAGFDLDELTKLGKKPRIAALRAAGEDEAANLLTREAEKKVKRPSLRDQGKSPRQLGTNPRARQAAPAAAPDVPPAPVEPPVATGVATGGRPPGYIDPTLPPEIQAAIRRGDERAAQRAGKAPPPAAAPEPPTPPPAPATYDSLMDAGRVEEAEALLGKQAEQQIRDAYSRGDPPDGPRAHRKTPGGKSEDGTTLVGGLMPFDPATFRRLVARHPGTAWRIAQTAAGAGTGYWLDDDHPARGLLLGALGGALVGRLPRIVEALVKAEVNIGRPRKGVDPVRLARNEGKDINLAELMAGTPERTIPTQFDKARPAYEKFISEIRKKYKEAGQPLSPAQVQSIRDKHLTPIIADIRKDAKLAAAAKQVYKAKYIKSFADRLAGHMTMGQRNVRMLSKGMLPHDFVEKWVGGSIYYTGTGYAADTAIQNMAQPLLALAHVPPSYLLKAAKALATDRATRTRIENILAAIEKPQDAFEVTGGAFGRKVRDIRNAVTDRIDPQTFLHLTDTWNRRIVYLGAEQLAQARGLDAQAASKWAGQVMRATQAEQGMLGTNPFHAGPIGGSLRPFTKYPTVFTELAIDTAKAAMQGKNLAGAGRLAATLGAAALASKATDIDLTDLLVSGGRPLGLDIMHPQRSAKRAASGQAMPAVRGAQDLMAHLSGTADHGALDDLEALALPRYVRKLADAKDQFSTEEWDAPHIKRNAGGEIRDVSTSGETVLNLLGLKSTRQTDRADALADFYEKGSAEKQTYESNRRRAYADLSTALDGGDAAGMQDAMQRIGNAGAVRQFLRQRGKLPEERFFNSLPPRLRNELRQAFQDTRATAPPR